MDAIGGKNGASPSAGPSKEASGIVAIGQALPRKEDAKLLTGRGRYTDDVNLPGQCHVAIVRSRHAHGILRSIGTEAAKAMPGVLGIYSAADVDAAGFGTFKTIINFPNRDGSAMKKPVRRALAQDRVRFVGDPVAFVVAETAFQAKDAADAVELEIEPLPTVVRARDAVAPGAPLVYDDVPGNVILDYHYGDAAKVAEAFERAAHVTRLGIVNNRLVVSAMEPRAAVAAHDAATGRWTIHVGCQGAFGLRNQLANDILGVPLDKVRVVAGNVGGSFGMKAAAYPEYVCLFHAARVHGRPAKWTDDRSGSFLSDTHGRDHEVTAELALDAEHNFLAVRISGHANLGAYVGNVMPMPSTLNVMKNAASLYRTPLLEVSMVCALTHTTPVSAYRGAGRPEGNYYMERLVETAAAELGLDPVELRRQNHIRPEELPFRASSGGVYDSGAFSAVLAEALESADWRGFERRKAESAARGKLRGRGIGNFLEVTAAQGKEMGGLHFERDGTVTIVTGTLDYGQGHATPFAQVLSQKLGVPFERINLVQGDSDRLVVGGGTGGSRSAMNSGGAIVEASEKVIAKGKEIASILLEAATVDIEFAEGRFRIAGTDRGIGIMDLAARLQEGLALPDAAPHTLDVDHVFEGVPSAYPNGCHIAEVEIDPETGVAEVVKYTSVNDFGTLLNPLMVAGQVHGGVVQGIGQALMERAVYDADGQLLTGSYMDYAMPRASDTVEIGFISHPVPCTTNPLGVKGCGEAGCAGSLPAVMNAVVDALSAYGIRHIDMPATPERVWRAIEDAKARGPAKA
ncbi:MAG TPA: xanthine dehydrogenase family protein molybdopterin-binding subunit [Alphaproteobacteria bacterium]|nr:xanthine dehydrogenase family protein molybdopterin-binding subunit [Alphaproteobacteria bacterium]